MAERPRLAQITPGPQQANKKRPPILKRTSHTSPQSTNPLSPSSGSSSIALLGSPRKERVTVELPEPKSEAALPMAAAFLQYCAMCEKQITTPCNSILYCSEACRRKDSLKPLSAASITSTMSTSTSTTPSTSHPSSPRAILLPPRLPTGVDAYLPSIRIPADDHGFKSDLDPSEWKPKLRRHRPTGSSTRHNSEAFRYLQSFHRAMNKDDDINEDGIRIDVPSLSLPLTEPPTPSLSLGTTPTTTASSSSWSIASARTPGYEFNTRPLMPRHNRWYSTSSIGGYGYGVDLVTPHIPPPPAPAPENAYAKKEVGGVDAISAEKGRSGLGAFFRVAGAVD